MELPNIFSSEVGNQIIYRINQLTVNQKPLWGKMNVAQMLAHCNVSFEIAFENIHPRPSGFRKILLRWFVKPSVVNTKPYRRNSPTAPVFKVPEKQDFEKEKDRLIRYIRHCMALGSDTFDGRDYPSFGELTIEQWNNLFYKHLNHHLTQFGV